MRKLHYLILLIPIIILSGCATSADLRALKAEMNQRLDEKMSALDSDLSDLKKKASTLDSIRSGQADTAADISELRESLQQLRGQVEGMKKDLAGGSKKDDQRLDNILMKINFIENFLEIGNGKHSLNDADKSKSTAAVTKDQTKKQDKEKAYSDAYQTFKEGNYDKARTEFQNFLAAFPDSEYSDNAQFWVGECYFFENKYEAAILEYEKVTKNYPNGNKVPYAMLKQGLSFLKLGDKTSAKLLLQEVIKNYPNTTQARVARSTLQDIK